MRAGKSNRRVALVTGSDRGIGFEVCRELGELGYQVILTSPDPGKGKISARKLQKRSLNVVYHVLDVVDEIQVHALKVFVLEKFRRLDVLVNNAGVMLDTGRSEVEGLIAKSLKNVPERLGFGDGPSILDVDIDIVRATLEVNTLGALRMCQAFVPGMMKAGYGRVINVSSTLGQLNEMTDEDSVPAYQMSKAALNSVTLMVADAARGNNVQVNSVCPGWTRTDIGGREAPQSVEEAAETIIWLARRPDNFPTGGFFRNKRRISW